jgi:sugar lactone lactonase YvrE
MGEPVPTYQWQLSTDGGNTWSFLADGAPYSGTATGTLTITGATPAMSGYEYECLASNSVQSNVASVAATLSVVPPAATADPGQAVIASGFIASWNSLSGATGYRLDVSTNSTFNTFVGGYQNVDVGNATSVTVAGLNANTTYYYRIRAYDSAGTGANSAAVAVTTSPPAVITAPLTVTTLAGQPLTIGNSDGIGSVARFYYPSGIAADSAGNLYLADTDNHTIRKIVASTGSVTTLAGLAGVSGDVDGAGSVARFNSPSGVAVDGAGNVYVADTLNDTLRLVTASGVVSTLAGTPGTAGSTDGTGSGALFHGPQGLALDASGNLYLADTNNQTIRKIVPSTGEVTTIAGSAGSAGSADGVGTVARFDAPSGLGVDTAGNVYVADADNHTVRSLSPAGLVATIAGVAGSSGGADGTGSAARFNSPSDLAVDASGNVYVADTDNFTIRELVPSTGAVTTLAGLAGTSGSADGLGSAVRFFHPAGIAMDPSRNLYLADTDNHTVRVALLAVAPSIQTQPQSQAVTAGDSAQFSVTASGRPAVTYQWYFGGAVISGATGSTYTVSDAQSVNAGNYTVVVSNSVSSLTSNNATLTVNPSGGGGGGGGSGGGGGGGAPSIWFYGVLSLLALARRRWRRN